MQTGLMFAVVGQLVAALALCALVGWAILD
jgi:hypothetical protein